jgi:hypothetical protein
MITEKIYISNYFQDDAIIKIITLKVLMTLIIYHVQIELDLP